MKTQVLNLESYDDRHSILDKLNWGQADRVIMIWPVTGSPLDSKLDLKLIHRRCQSADIKLALVCKKSQVVDFASELGIPVFRSLRQAQRVPWEYTLKPPREIVRPANKRSREELSELIQQSTSPDWTKRKGVRTFSFVISIVSVLVLAAFLVPGARVEYLPEFVTQNLSITLSASPDFQAFNLSGAIPAHYLSVTVEGRGEIETTGQTWIPENAASGIIEFTNLTNQEIIIPRGTVIRTNDPASQVRFTTIADTTLNPESGATTSVPIEATNPGLQGNLLANSLVIIEGDLSRSITVSNPEPTSGGDRRLSPSPAPEDYQDLSEELLTSLWQTALDEAKSTLEERDVILDSSPREAVILEEKFSPAEPQPSNTLALLLRVEYEIAYLEWNELQTMGNAILNVTMPPEFNAQPETFTIKTISPPEYVDNDQVNWDVEIARKIFTEKKLSKALKQILGRPPEYAATILQKELSLSETPQISLFPEWWPVMPLLEIRIEAVDQLQDG